ncbi:MAG: hypothetical protein QMD08_04975 [Actinomycetota bacterium]|nr:hypothetical protein [Actinomycetota bacterium]
MHSVVMMRIYIVCPDKYEFKKRKPFTTIFNDVFAQRFVQHLRDDPELCTGCGAACGAVWLMIWIIPPTSRAF